MEPANALQAERASVPEAGQTPAAAASVSVRKRGPTHETHGLARLRTVCCAGCCTIGCIVIGASGWWICIGMGAIGGAGAGATATVSKSIFLIDSTESIGERRR